jgi:uncharacterized protein (DUF4415 family)
MMKLALLLWPGSKRGFIRLFGRGVEIGGGSYRLGGREMARKGHIMKYTTEELDELVKKEGSRSDWKKAAGMTDVEIEAAVASDPDEADMVIDWDSATAELPKPKAVLNMRIDKDVLEYFRNTGKGYQTLINSVLRSYVKSKKQHRNHD